MNLLISKPKSDLNFYANGVIEINRKISSELELKDGDFINIAERDGEYILLKSTYGVKMRKTNTTQRHPGFMRGHNVELCKMMIKDKTLAKYRVGESTTIDNKKMLYIITRMNYATD